LAIQKFLKRSQHKPQPHNRVLFICHTLSECACVCLCVCVASGCGCRGDCADNRIKKRSKNWQHV